MILTSLHVLTKKVDNLTFLLAKNEAKPIKEPDMSLLPPLPVKTEAELNVLEDALTNKEKSDNFVSERRFS